MSDFTMREFALRAALESDLEKIVAIDGASFSQPWQPQTFAQQLYDEKTRVVVAHDVALDIARALGDEIFGFGVAYVVGDEGEIATLAVAQSARGCGLGQQLLQSLCDWCASRGAARVFLEVRESNASAQRLYGRLGFVVVGQRKNYYADGETALLMKREF